MGSVYNQGVHVDRAEVDKLKEIARKAERAGQSLILLPPHRSHIDYVTLQWIFFRLGLSLPLGNSQVSLKTRFNLHVVISVFFLNTILTGGMQWWQETTSASLS